MSNKPRDTSSAMLSWEKEKGQFESQALWPSSGGY